MQFTSLPFAVFMTAVFVIYWVLPHKFRWAMLLIFSYSFYMSWNPSYILILLLTTAMTYFTGLYIEKEGDKKRRRGGVVICVIVCVFILFIFKYLNFAISSATKLLSIFSLKIDPVVLNISLPVGISFYIFQSMGYIIDVYRRKIKAERHFGYYATFISFFPQILSGPIGRAGELLPQFRRNQKFSYETAVSGLRRILWGIFKKMIVADTLAIYVEKVYNAPDRFTGFASLLAILFFTIQIYCDFSGYSDLAIGLAGLLNIRLRENFKAPYLATSLNDFWRCWHMSLSTWFRDYVYIPLGGNRCSKMRQRFNLLITFLVSGFWHGANWTFLLWGGIHGIGQIIENSLKRPLALLKQRKIGIFICWLLAFTFVNLAWVFFKAPSVTTALNVIAGSLTGLLHPLSYIRNGFSLLGIDEAVLLQLVAIFALFIGIDVFINKKDALIRWHRAPKPIRWGGYIIFIWLIMYLMPQAPSQFIYFKF